MYTGGKLLFADHIFNGYGNAKKDFLKQVWKLTSNNYLNVFICPYYHSSFDPVED